MQQSTSGACNAKISDQFGTQVNKVENIGWHVGSSEPNHPGREPFLAVYTHGSASTSWNDYGGYEGYKTGFAACEYRIGLED